jgi:hypothetical protein
MNETQVAEAVDVPQAIASWVAEHQAEFAGIEFGRAVFNWNTRKCDLAVELTSASKVRLGELESRER